ncbi:hypothetical protein, partial [Qipengyuania soli]
MAVYTNDDGISLVDLTTLIDDTDIDATVNGAYFTIEALESSSGTGLIQSFVRLQQSGDEDGYNTSGRPINDPDVNTSLQFTHNLLLADVPIVMIDGVPHYEFLLDINQTNANPLISLDELQLYTSSTASLTSGVETAAFQNATDLVYDLDGAGDTSILLNYELQSGSGAADMYFYVPVSDFTGDPATTYVYLFSSFGELGALDATDEDGTGDIPDALYGSYATNDGFEEWAVSRTISGPTIDGYKWEDSNGNGVWDQGEQALSGWKFDYSYTIGNGSNAVTYNGTAVTDANGRYIIPIVSSNQAYTITITEQVQDGWINTYDGDATVNGSTQVVIGRNLTNLPDGDPLTTERMNFGNFEKFDISGTKYTDITGDGLSEDDTGLGG